MEQSPEKTTRLDTELIESTLQGNRAAFGELVQRYWSLAVALALSRLADTADAEDIAQDSFIKAHAKLHTLQDHDRFAGWLSQIVIHHCVNAHRQRQRQQRSMGRAIRDEAVLANVTAYSANPGLTAQQIHFVRQTLGKLPARFKRPIIMRFVGGLSAVEIARQLGKRPGTVRVWLHRGYQLLRQELAPLLEEVQS